MVFSQIFDMSSEESGAAAGEVVTNAVVAVTDVVVAEQPKEEKTADAQPSVTETAGVKPSRSGTLPPQQYLRVTPEQIDQIIQTIKDVLAGRKMTAGIMLRVVANCMNVTRKMKISNTVKKQVVTVGLERYIREQSDLNDDEVQALMALVDTVVDDAIDTLADVHNAGKACCTIA